ncbi:hypothetical protein DM826_00370 [Halonotius aquaticus]|uniref:Uncharacterized protein n=1 Tax=Halonotius aquaticus TaxID=2216978 RepID=A0A3A6Q3H3_9EURY|nr:hypothetical protein [Halonotius aquaticus]RJX45186.1 hypothetical protein DM826_00370 [Halonotius aquaticus]
MGKVNVGLRGWRFAEDDIFNDDGMFKQLEEIPKDDRQRLLRLVSLVEKPCDACRLIHGEEEIHRARQAAVVYGEPNDEVVLCTDHEADFLYWYQNDGGSEHRGTAAFDDAFEEWFDNGGRAPEEFEAVEHVETDPEGLPDPPDAQELNAMLSEGYEPERIDLREYVDDETAEAANDALADGVIDETDMDYPTADE